MKASLKTIALIASIFILGFNFTFSRVEFSDENRTALNNPAAQVAQLKNAEASVNYPYVDMGTLETEQIIMSFTNQGHFGTGFSNYSDTFPSFESPPESVNEYLFGGSIWIGGISGIWEDTLVSVGADGWNYTREMWPENESRKAEITEYEHDYYSFHWRSLRAEFYDTLIDPSYVQADYFDGRPHKPLNLRIANRGHEWSSEQYEIVYDMVITNIGRGEIKDGYIGFYFDGDVYYGDISGGGYADDLTGSLRDEGIGYIIDNDGKTVSYENFYLTRILAFKFLDNSFDATDTSYNWWMSNGDPALDFGPRMKGTPEDPFRDFGGFLGTPEGDRNKYYIMSHREWDYDQIWTATIDSSDTTWLQPVQSLACNLADGYDTRFLMSIGPFDLMPDSSIRLLYTIFTTDSVHVDSNNFNDNFSCEDPSVFYSNLEFDDVGGVIWNGNAAEMIADYLLDPVNPVVGLQAEYESSDKVIIEWDPWVFDDVVGYDIYLSEANYASWPYEGVSPPWYKPASMNKVAEVGKTYSHTFDDLTPGSGYYVNVANRTGTSVGHEGNSVFIKTFVIDDLKPIIEQEFVFDSISTSAMLNWTVPGGSDVHHFNIYRFDNADSAANKYHRFYDRGQSGLIPKDSFLIDTTMYYYYAMEIYTQVSAGTTTFTDDFAGDNNVYVITAVNSNGFESAFSDPITFHVIDPHSKDILVLVDAISKQWDYVLIDTIKNYYNSLLETLPGSYDHDFYYLRDTLKYCSVYYSFECVDWHDFAQYKMVIIEDGLDEAIGYLADYENQTKGMTKYLLSGGKICYFGNLGNFGEYRDQSQSPLYYAVESPFNRKFFGVDSVFYYHEGHDFPNFINDSLFGLVQAVGMIDGPVIGYDSLRFPYDSANGILWHLLLLNESFELNNTAPKVSTFSINEYGRPTHLYKSKYPESSLLENEPVGVVTQTDETTTYLFGFHLWYMDPVQAGPFVQYVMDYDCPSIAVRSTIDTVLCELGEICIDVDAANYNTVNVSQGVWSDDVLCFTPAETGSHDIIIEASNDSCSVETQVKVNVSIDKPIEVNTYRLLFYTDDSTSLPDSQLVIVDTQCGEGTANWNLIMSGDADWLAANKISGSYPDSVWMKVDTLLPVGIYNGWIGFESDDAEDTVYINVDYVVESGVFLEDVTIYAGYYSMVPLRIFTTDSIRGYTIPVELVTEQFPNVAIASINVLDPMADTIIPVDDNFYIIHREIQDPPLPDSQEVTLANILIYVSAYAYSENAELRIIDTSIVIEEKATYDYGFWYDADSMVIPSFNSGKIEIIGLVDVFDDEDDNLLPGEFMLRQNYPNPFNPITIIEFSLPRHASVTIDIYNILGQKVNSLVNGDLSAGHHSVQWNGTDSNGRPVASGMYFYRIQADEFVKTRKMLLLK